MMPKRAKQKGTNPVTMPDSGPGQQCSQTSSHDFFQTDAAAEIHRRITINQQEDRALPLFLINLGMWFASAGGYPPIHRANIIARLVAARLLVIHATAAEAGVLLTTLGGTAAPLTR